MDDQIKKARKLATNYLARSNYHSDVLCKKLQDKGIDKSIARQAISELSYYIDDRAYLESVIRVELSRGHGPKAIVWKLSSKGLSQEAIQEAIASFATQEVEMAAIIQWLEKHKPSQRHEAIGKLLRRGFSLSAITSALQEFTLTR